MTVIVNVRWLELQANASPQLVRDEATVAVPAAAARKTAVTVPHPDPGKGGLGHAETVGVPCAGRTDESDDDGPSQ
jgi:hypothetical protein